MSISFESGGLVTLGMGEDHRLCTIGMAMRFEFGGIRPIIKKLKEYDLNISAAISKEVFFERGIYCPFEVKKNRELLINSRVFKEVEEDLNMKINLNYNQLSDALDLV